jgi:hypothetical protein
MQIFEDASSFLFSGSSADVEYSPALFLSMLQGKKSCCQMHID